MLQHFGYASSVCSKEILTCGLPALLNFSSRYVLAPAITILKNTKAKSIFLFTVVRQTQNFEDFALKQGEKVLTANDQDERIGI